MKTVAILHGWAGGLRLTKIFVEELEKSGFKHIRDSREANIIFAHSTGCYRLPENSKAKLVILHGPPYWPSKSILKRLLWHKGHDTSLHLREKGILFASKRLFWEIVYIIIEPSYTFIALKNHRSLHFLDLIEDKKALLTRNEEDYFCSPEIKKAISKYKNVRYVTLPGGHDDYLLNPQPYVDLIRKHL